MKKLVFKKVLVTLFCMVAGIALPLAMLETPTLLAAFLPMQLPILLCGLANGWPWGLACGLLVPFASHFLLQVPSAQQLSGGMLQLAVLGFAAGMLYRYVRVRLWVALLFSVLLGWLSYGGLKLLLFFTENAAYSFSAFLGEMFVGLPGIVAQLILLPLLVLLFQKLHLSEKPARLKS